MIVSIYEQSIKKGRGTNTMKAVLEEQEYYQWKTLDSGRNNEQYESQKMIILFLLMCAIRTINEHFARVLFRKNKERLILSQSVSNVFEG